MKEENALYREKKQDLRREELGMRVLENARTELYLHMRFLDAALASLKPTADGALHPAGTDGQNFLFSAREVTDSFLQDRRKVNRLYMHTLMHCLFGHLFADPKEVLYVRDQADASAYREPERKDGSVQSRPEREDGSVQSRPVRKDTSEETASMSDWQTLWNLSCDIAAEYLLDELALPCVHQKKSALRQTLFAELRQALPVVTAQLVCRFLSEKGLSAEEEGALQEEFCRDDHSRWHSASGRQQQERQKHWEDLRGRMQTEMETFSKESASGTKALHDRLAIENRRRYDYREFLRKFSVLREEMQVDPDSFDYIFYHYGLELYGNMPLIEPMETKEVYRIEDFVIVLDTSMSCRQELIRRFLEETFTILSGRAGFARKVRIRLIQCDDRVQKDTKITDLADIKSYMEDFQILGMGGTDFRPAFAYVNELVARKEFHHLKGLLYFTDGYGIFPVKKPLYDTAFVFVKHDYRDVDVPPWAMKVILDDAAGGDLLRSI